MNELVNIMKEFAEKYNFIQEADIEKIEASEFNREKYFEIDNKLFISLNERKEILIGKINICIDTIEEEEWYYIDRKFCFVINITDYSNSERLLEEIIKECKTHNLI